MVGVDGIGSALSWIGAQNGGPRVIRSTLAIDAAGYRVLRAPDDCDNSKTTSHHLSAFAKVETETCFVSGLRFEVLRHHCSAHQQKYGSETPKSQPLPILDPRRHPPAVMVPPRSFSAAK